MSLDTEWEVWRQQWQSGTAVPFELRRKVEQQTRFMKVALIARILVTLTIGGGTTIWAMRSSYPPTVLVAVVTWVFIAIAWAFRLTVDHGNWSPSAQDSAAFIDLSVRRCRARLVAVWFSAGLFVFQIAFLLSWVYRHSAEHNVLLWKWLFFGSVSIDIVWLCTAAFVGFLIWFRRQKRAELANLLVLRAEITGSAPESSNQQLKPWILRTWPHLRGARSVRRSKREV